MLLRGDAAPLHAPSHEPVDQAHRRRADDHQQPQLPAQRDQHAGRGQQGQQLEPSVAQHLGETHLIDRHVVDQPGEQVALLVLGEPAGGEQLEPVEHFSAQPSDGRSADVAGEVGRAQPGQQRHREEPGEHEKQPGDCGRVSPGDGVIQQALSRERKHHAERQLNQQDHR